MKRKFGNLLMTAALVLAVGVFFTSCRDHDEELVAVIESQAQTLEEVDQALADAKEELKDAVESAQGSAGVSIDSLGAVIDALEDRIAVLEGTNYDHSGFATKQELEDSIAAVRAELENAIQELANAKADKAALKEVADSLDALKGEFDNHVELFLALSDKVSDAVSRLEVLEGRYADLDSIVKSVDAKYGKLIEEVKGDLAKVEATANAADARSKNDSVRIDALEALGEKISQGLKDSIAAVRAEAAANLEAAKAYADEVAAAVAEELNGKLDETNATVADLQKAFDEAVAELQDQIDVLQEEVDEVLYALEELEEELGFVKKYLENQITSVVLQGAYSPVVGYFSLPTGVKSNILAAYYGDKVGKFEFAGTNYNADVLTGGNGNAGKLYLTFNPAEVNVTADQLKLVNSLGEESPVKITDLKVSTDKLVFGYTRAGAALYEAEATIAAEDVEAAKLRIELSELKDALKDVMTVEDGVNVTNLVTTLYTLVNDIADANAVQATWTDAEEVEHTVYSDFGLAAVAVKPLNYDFSVAINSVPGYQNIVNLVNRVFDKAGDIQIPDLGLGNLELPSIKSIDIEGLKDGNIQFRVKLTKVVKYHLYKEVPVPVEDAISVWTEEETYDVKDAVGNVVGTVVVPAQEISIKGKDIVNGKVTIDEWLEIPVDIDEFVSVPKEDVLGDLTASLDDINEMISSLDSFLKQINDMLADVNGKVESVETLISSALNKVQSGLNSYLSKLNNKLCSMINSFNAALQPTMLVATENGFSMLSSIKGAPTTIDAASAVLVPTSFTAEILAPAFKKHVAVTAAYDADGDSDATAVTDANTGVLNTVLPGETRTVAFNGKAGYTYEITYSACDYKGNTVETKYYVRVK